MYMCMYSVCEGPGQQRRRCTAQGDTCSPLGHKLFRLFSQDDLDDQQQQHTPSECLEEEKEEEKEEEEEEEEEKEEEEEEEEEEKRKKRRTAKSWNSLQNYSVP